MGFEDLIYCIRVEFLKEHDKRKDLLDKIAELQDEIEQLNRDLKAYRSFYPMKNEVCEKCMFADECIDENRVEGKLFCSSFHAVEEDPKK